MEEGENKSLVRILFSLAFVLLVISLLLVYWFIPFNTIEFEIKPGNYNFSLGDSNKEGIQFYQNMRYSNSRISYRIDNCPLQKKNDMEGAFEILSDKTILEFYPVLSGEEISIECDSTSKIEGGLFIAGEGGPTNITRAGEFNVILHGTILLIRESQCERPNVALHELLHALGFEHSLNPNNIMYEVSKCKQIIGDDTIELIDEIYSLSSYPDLAFENVSALMNGRYLDANISVRNIGLHNANEAKIKIYAEDKFVKEVELDALDIGYGSVILLNNIIIKKTEVNKLIFLIDYNFDELDKINNEITLDVK